MANETDGKTGGCTFQWRIENISHCCCLQKDRDKDIESPNFVVDSLQLTKWSLIISVSTKRLFFYLHRNEDCCGPSFIEVFFKFSFLGKDGSILKTENPKKDGFEKGAWRSSHFCLEREMIFGTERESFLTEDALNVQCKIWLKDEQNAQLNNMFAASAIKVEWRLFKWRINEISTLESDKRNNFKDYMFGSNVVLKKSLDKLDVNISSINKSINYISCNTWIFDSKGSKENCGIKKYFDYDIDRQFLSFTVPFPNKVMENKSQYFSNDVLSLEFEFVLATIEHNLDCSKNSVTLENYIFEKEKLQNVKVLIDELNSMYNDGIFSDMELRTSSKTFPVHKMILSARSPVFRRMFSSDLKERNSGCVDIADFDDETVQRMLQYLYTASLEDLEFESACKLYEIADKYEILSLKSKCSSFLVENLWPTNACEVLVLAFHHNDDQLSSEVQNYVLREHKQIFHSQKWKEFMSTHLQLAADIMLKKLTESV